MGESTLPPQTPYGSAHATLTDQPGGAAPDPATLLPCVRAAESERIMTQEPYKGFDLSDDLLPEDHDQRAPCVLIMDVSGSMDGEPIRELNAGLSQYRDEILGESLTARRVDVAIVSFGDRVEVVQHFTNAYSFAPPELRASGPTPMASAVLTAIKLLEERKDDYRRAGMTYYRPWLFLFTDGAPTDGVAEWQVACEAVRRGEAENKFTFYAVGVSGADFGKLKEISPSRAPLKLKGVAFREFFKWLSNSQGTVARSTPGQAIALPPATGDDGWGVAAI
jgi:uncharacterized protein YegL